MAEGEFAQVKYHLDAGIGKFATERGSMAADLDMYAMAADTAARSKDREGLERYLTIAEEAAGKADHKLYIAVTQRARGISDLLDDDLDNAAEQLSSAADSFRALDASWQLGRTLLELGEVESSRGNGELANDHYSEALSSFESLGASPYADRARAALN